MKRLLCIALLSGCAAAYQPDARDAAVSDHMAWVESQVQTGKMTRREGAISNRDKLRELGISDGHLEELWAYRVMLAGQVERGEISSDQASYLDRQKGNQLMERINADEAAQRTSRPAVYRRAITCRPDGYGGTRCQ